MGQKRPKREFTRNEAIELQHEDRACALRKIADHIERFKEEYRISDVLELLREIADEAEAQSMVVALRDKL